MTFSALFRPILQMTRPIEHSDLDEIRLVELLFDLQADLWKLFWIVADDNRGISIRETDFVPFTSPETIERSINSFQDDIPEGARVVIGNMTLAQRQILEQIMHDVSGKHHKTGWSWVSDIMDRAVAAGLMTEKAFVDVTTHITINRSRSQVTGMEQRLVEILLDSVGSDTWEILWIYEVDAEGTSDVASASSDSPTLLIYDPRESMRSRRTFSSTNKRMIMGSMTQEQRGKLEDIMIYSDPRSVGYRWVTDVVTKAYEQGYVDKDDYDRVIRDIKHFSRSEGPEVSIAPDLIPRAESHPNELGQVKLYADNDDLEWEVIRLESVDGPLSTSTEEIEDVSLGF